MSDLLKEAYQILKTHSFKRKGTTWNKSIDAHLTWVINFQKGKSGTKEAFDLTVNVGVYTKGASGMVFGKEPEFILEVDCFFRQRPRFFGMNADWWDFNSHVDHAKVASEIFFFLKDKVIPFLEHSREFDKLLSYLPIEKWSNNRSFHHYLFWVAVACALMERKAVAEVMLQTISKDKDVWAEKAESILSKIK